MNCLCGHELHKSFKVNATGKFAVVDLASVKVDHTKASSAGAPGRDKTRLTKSTGQSIKEGAGHIGGPFTVTTDPQFLAERLAAYDAIAAKRRAQVEDKPKVPISVTLPNGDVKEGTAWVTTPYDIAASIAQGLADSSVVAKVKYTGEVDKSELGLLRVEDGLDMENGAAAQAGAELWDMTRPLIGDCELQLLKFDDPDAKAVFWHSSAHVLGECLEKKYGAHLTIGPPLQDGFYYDAYMGDHGISTDDFKDINTLFERATKEKQQFERMVVSKEEALELFKYNAFKVSIIASKIPDGGFTTVYRNGPLIDLCRGPHIPHSGKIKAYETVKNSGTNWLGQVDNDALQRVYGISFPDSASLKKWKKFQEQAKEKDHRRVGVQQDLFFFHTLSPGSGFFGVHGTRLYNKLTDFIKKQYWLRGYTEIITPNIFNLDLWNTSGHAAHYKQNMFVFDVEGQEFAMKPMNCPGHCLVFANKSRSYRELPMRLAEFGVLHRNEISGALTGLTRVRKFVQDDSHIFCREDQVKKEVLGCLEFMKFVYGVFGMTYRLELSTKPEKALGDDSLWHLAEQQLEEALNEFTGGPEHWRVNPGDGAFYGPKIDIKVFDALERAHQCATIQLDFQLPIRFKLRYKAATEGEEYIADGRKTPLEINNDDGDNGGADGNGHAPGHVGTELESGYKRPIMVHRAMLGSVERMIAVLTEHYGGKWPFWLSPRQALVVPVSQTHVPYAQRVKKALYDAGFYADVEDSSKTLNKKVREGQLAQYNFILVVGSKEEEDGSVNIRTRDNVVRGTVLLAECIEKFRQYDNEYTPDV